MIEGKAILCDFTGRSPAAGRLSDRRPEGPPADHDNGYRVTDRPPFRLTLPLLCGLALAQPALAEWLCRAGADGQWQCAGAGDEPVPAPRTPVPTAAPASSPGPTTPVATAPAAAAAPVTPPAPATPRLCRPLAPLAEPLPGPGQTETRMAAREARTEQGNRFLLRGGARIERAGQRLTADEIRYDKTRGVAEAEGRVRLDDPELAVTGSRARLALDSDQGEIHDVHYALRGRHARGEAAAAFQESADRKRFEAATYTTCDADAESWRLRAREVVLDEASGVGKARHVRLEAGGVPVLYSPWLSFPIDDRRKSGFLVPGWGRSDEGGVDIRIPYYWNIAPNRDATLTPRYLGKRGLMMKGEYRYLTRDSRGQLDLEYLPSDDAFGGRNRTLLGIRHQGRLSERLQARVDIRSVSDAEYFEDLGDNLGLSALTHINRVAELRYSAPQWTLSGRLQDFQTVDRTIPATRRPYGRLPQLRLAARPDWHPGGIDLQLNAEIVRFDKADAVTGTRYDLTPTLSLPLGRAAWFLTPALALRHTGYRLDGVAAGDPDAPTRTNPIASLDGGLFLERSTEWFGTRYTQTLEPRAFYLYVPERDQSAIPVFDTSLRDFSYAQLFATNRFTGADRMGDANQLTLAVTSRLLDPASGAQRARFALGDILYFRDRTVTLPGRAPERQASSNLVALADLSLSPAWSLAAGLQWDPHETKTDRSNLRLQYRAGERRLLNLVYRYRSDRLEQITLSGLWQLTPRWQLVGRWSHSLPDSTLLEGLGGVEYETCCWIARLVGRSYINNTAGERNTAVLFQIELKGLTSFGDPVSETLRSGILGY